MNVLTVYCAVEATRALLAGGEPMAAAVSRVCDRFGLRTMSDFAIVAEKANEAAQACAAARIARDVEGTEGERLDAVHEPAGARRTASRKKSAVAVAEAA